MASEDYISVRRLQLFYKNLQEEIASEYATKDDAHDGAVLHYTADTANGDRLQINDGTAVNIVNSKHSTTSDAATNDASGNAITTTYATKTELQTAVGNIETLLAAI